MAKKHELIERIDNYQKEMHQMNQKRIKIGIWLLIGIPLTFLFLLFITNSNKIIFLVLWITSLFLIASYLIIIEYEDYKLQKNLNKIRGDEDAEVETLIDLDSINERVENVVESAKEHREFREERREEKREEIKEKLEGLKESIEARRNEAKSAASPEESSDKQEDGQKE